MSDEETLASLRERMDALGLSQAEVAEACGFSQPHLSKVLAGKVKLARKTRAAVHGWLTCSVPSGMPLEPGEWERLIERLRSRPPAQFMQIMQVLRLLERLST
ncbi:helix-turn-helix domain-containing protein [Methylobacterium sp. NPDC080182]|uniref:helix-turn-helix domain-containing protein n=1 Tax=Methylobacterium sp. NPDC080182 TaxID=3390590 RepID=UPI003D078484